MSKMVAVCSSFNLNISQLLQKFQNMETHDDFICSHELVRYMIKCPKCVSDVYFNKQMVFSCNNQKKVHKNHKVIVKHC